MARQTDAQKDTVERVMHEYKHGELVTAAGDMVTSRRQAVAIGLSEAGSSSQRTPAEDRERLRDTKAKKRGGRTARQRDEGDPTRVELYEQAKRRDIPGRSKMSKAELAKAVKA